MHITNRTLITAITFAFAGVCSAQHGDEPSLTRIQQILAGKKHVDLTHAVDRAREKMGERAWTNSARRICGDADGLVEAMAGRGKNDKQGYKRRRALSRLELARAQISL